VREHRTGRAWRGLATLTATLAVVAALAPGAAAQRQDLVVQSTTSVRDSGLLDRLIAPRFERRFPEWDLKFVAVGTGQAITNARAGQGDVLIGHSPALEQQFVMDGFSYEPIGRTVMWNDFVIVGPASDPAGVMTATRNDAVGAFEALAAAGAAGRANFVSRGDNSGTNNKEREIWGLSGVPRTSTNEPSEGSGNPAWYHKAGLGMADTLRLTQQCPFSGGGCYTITDRGTLQQLTSNGAITALQVAMDGQSANARGGENLMLNVYNVYAINPAKYPSVKLEGALAFMDFLTSQSFQRSLGRFPSVQQPGFFPAAFPGVTFTRRLPHTVSAARRVTIAGRTASTVPGAAPLAGLLVRLTRFATPLNPIVEDRDRAGARGAFRLRARLTRSGTQFLTTPRFRNLSPRSLRLGGVRLRASVSLAPVQIRSGGVVLRGRSFPASDRRRAVIQVRARRAGAQGFGLVRRVRLPRRGSRYRIDVNLPAGSWELRTRYVDKGIVAPGASRVRSVSVP
jgi:tungstate transport system substrate-binding protein